MGIKKPIIARVLHDEDDEGPHWDLDPDSTLTWNRLGGCLAARGVSGNYQDDPTRSYGPYLQGVPRYPLRS